MDDLEYAIDNIGPTKFEELSMAFLRSIGYVVHESGHSGADGGWDARVSLGGQEGIAHASIREDWRRKIRLDAEKVADLETDRGDNYDLLVFLTNQDVKGGQELEMENEIQDDYGWNLKIYHRANLLGEIRANHPRLASEYLDIDLGVDRDHLDRLIELRDVRLEQIQQRTGDASNLVEGPTIVIHVIPNGIFSNQVYSGEVPTPPILWETNIPYGEVRGKSTYASSATRLDAETDAYGILRNDGLYETAFSLTYAAVGDYAMPLNVSNAGPGFDAFVVLTVKRALGRLREMNFVGSAFVSVAFLDATELRGQRHQPGKILFSPETKPIGVDRYVTDPHFVTIDGEGLIGELKPVIDEVWRQLGQSEGTDDIEEGVWVGPNVEFRDVELRSS